MSKKIVTWVKRGKEDNENVSIDVIPFDYEGNMIHRILFWKDIVEKFNSDSNQYVHKVSRHIPNTFQTGNVGTKDRYLEIDFEESNIEKVEKFSEIVDSNGNPFYQLVIVGKGSTDKDDSGVSIRAWEGSESFCFVLKEKEISKSSVDLLIKRKLVEEENVYSPKINYLRVTKNLGENLEVNTKYVIRMNPGFQGVDKWGEVSLRNDLISGCWLAGNKRDHNDVFDPGEIEKFTQDQSLSEEPSTHENDEEQTMFKSLSAQEIVDEPIINFQHNDLSTKEKKKYDAGEKEKRREPDNTNLFPPMPNSVPEPAPNSSSHIQEEENNHNYRLMKMVIGGLFTVIIVIGLTVITYKIIKRKNK